MSKQITSKSFGQVINTSGGGVDRPGDIAQSGNWAAEQERRRREQESGEHDGFFGAITGLVDRAVTEVAVAYTSMTNQASQTSLDMLPADALEGLDPDTVLRFAFGPEDMAALDLQGEHDAIAESGPVFTVNNPTPELMSYLVESGQFEDMIWSGHGDENGMWITNEEGKAELLPAEDLAKMVKDTPIDQMLLNVCNGGGAVADALNEVGIDTFGYERELGDDEAIEDAVEFVEEGDLAAIDTSSHIDWSGGGWFPMPRFQEGGRFSEGAPPPGLMKAMGMLAKVTGKAASAAMSTTTAQKTPETGAGNTSSPLAGAGASVGGALGAAAGAITTAGKEHVNSTYEGPATAPKTGVQAGGMGGMRMM